MTQPLITICVHLRPDVDRQPIEQIVVGSRGKLRPKQHDSRFWASTSLTLKQVQSIEGVKSVSLAPKSW